MGRTLHEKLMTKGYKTVKTYDALNRESPTAAFVSELTDVMHTINTSGRFALIPEELVRRVESSTRPGYVLYSKP